MISVTKLELRQQWQDQVNTFRASGLSATKWCAEHNLKLHQLRYWLRQFPMRSSESTHLKSSTQRWLSVQTDSATSILNDAGALRVHVGVAVIEVQSGYDPVLLTQLVQTLAQCSME